MAGDTLTYTRNRAPFRNPKEPFTLRLPDSRDSTLTLRASCESGTLGHLPVSRAEHATPEWLDPDLFREHVLSLLQPFDLL